MRKRLLIWLLMPLLFFTQGASAQTWFEMCQWVRGEGKYKLAEMAHPRDYEKNGILSCSVEYSSSSITVSMRFRGYTHDYTDMYTINKGVKNGRTYFRNILIQEEYDPLFAAFRSIDNFGVGYENAYYRRSGPELYDGSNFNDLSRGEKAAFVLSILFQNSR